MSEEYFEFYYSLDSDRFRFECPLLSKTTCRKISKQMNDKVLSKHISKRLDYKMIGRKIIFNSIEYMIMPSSVIGDLAKLENENIELKIKLNALLGRNEK